MSSAKSGEIAVDLKMWSVKLEALEKGRHTDFTFRVCPDKEVRVLKFETVSLVSTLFVC